MKYNRDKWSETVLDRELQKKYGENWRAVKRSLKRKTSV